MLRILFSLFVSSITLVTLAQTVLPIDPAVRIGRLPNGLTYYLRYNNQTPGQADFYLANKVGSILETPEQRGLAHFVEHMGFNGTKHFPDGNGKPNSVRNWCENHGIKFGADLNASTSMEHLHFNINNAQVSQPGIADTCLLILRDWAGSLLLKDEEIDAERGVIHEEWRSRRTKFATTRMMEDAMPFIYAGSKYADALPIGHIEVVDTCRYDVLRKYYTDWFRPDLQGVIVVGDIDVDKTEKQIKELFSDLVTPADAPQRPNYTIPDNKEMMVYSQADNEQPTLNLMLYMKRDPEPRENRNTRESFVEEYKSKLAMFVLRQRLAPLSNQKDIKVMSCGGRNANFYVSNAKEAFCVTMGLFPKDPKAGIDAIIEVVEKLRRYGVTESELSHAKDQHTVSIEHDLDNKDKTRNHDYVNKLQNNFYDNTPAMAIEYEADLQGQLSQSVSLEEVNAVLKEIITDENQVCIVFGPTKYDGEAYTMPTDQQFRQWIEEAQQRDYPNDVKNTEIDYTFMKKLPKKGKIVSKKDVGNGYIEYELSNGIKVSARPSDIEPNRLMLNMFRLGGTSLYSDDDAITNKFVSNVVRESGAADFDYLMLEKKRRGKALRVTPFIEGEEEGVKGVCVASDLKTWLEIMYLYLTQPRKDEAIFNAFMARQESMAKNRTANPNVAYNDSLRMAVYGKSERTLPISVELLAKADHNRMYEIYKERFSNLYGMHLVVTGDIRMDEFEELLCQYVASLPAKKMKPQGVGPYALDIKRGARTTVYGAKTKTPSALTNIVYSADMPYTAENDLKADVLSQIMRTVYTETIREEKGGTYGVSVATQCWKYPTPASSMTINFRCSPDKYEELLPVIDQQLRLMAENGPTEEQLQKVKMYERKNYERAILTNGWWEYVRYHQLREGVDFEKDYLKKVDALTPADIRDFCKMFVTSGNRVQVTMK